LTGGDRDLEKISMGEEEIKVPGPHISGRVREGHVKGPKNERGELDVTRGTDAFDFWKEGEGGVGREQKTQCAENSEVWGRRALKGKEVTKR